MKAILRTKAGKEFSTMKVQEIKADNLQNNQVRIKMKASRVNPIDMDLMKGLPTLKYKNPQIGGVDGAGEIVEKGADVANFNVGDNIFFYRKFSDIGSWAEEITVNASDIAAIPINIEVQDAGSLALPLLTAYEALMSLSSKPGERILIHGAGGGVGYQAVQLAKHFGLKVIVNASESQKEILEKEGAEQFINYKTEDFEQILQADPPEYVFDVIGKKTLAKSIALKPKKVVSVAFPDTSKMHKLGVKLPGILNWLINFMNRKFVKAATKYQVELIGQATGADGNLLQKASDIAGKIDFSVRPYKTVTLDEIEENGLSGQDIGKVIVFA